MSCAPGTWISSHWSSFHEQSSHIHTSASMGVSEITSFYRWQSPSHVEVFCYGKSALGCLSHWLTQTQHTQCPLLVHGQSPLSSTVGIHSLWWQHTVRVTALHCLLKVRWSHARKMLYNFCAALSKRNQFLYDFQCWVPGSCPMPADGATG